MRDAFGGAFMLKLFLIFIFIYIFFTALALNYAKAFKVKNLVIDYLEDNEIVDLDNMSAFAEATMEEYFEKEILSNRNYKVNVENFCSHIGDIYNEAGNRIAYCSELGIVIRRTGQDSKTGGVYYTVSTYVGWDAGFLNIFTSASGDKKTNDEINGTWKISGQTRLIVRKN